MAMNVRNLNTFVQLLDEGEAAIQKSEPTEYKTLPRYNYLIIKQETCDTATDLLRSSLSRIEKSMLIISLIVLAKLYDGKDNNLGSKVHVQLKHEGARVTKIDKKVRKDFADGKANKSNPE